MAELQTSAHELTTADLAGPLDTQRPPDVPKLVKGQQPETVEKAAASASKPTPLFSESEMREFRSRWSDIQTGFVDEPRRTVEDADKLVASVMQRPREGSRTSDRGWKSSGTRATTYPRRTLRVALQRYRSFFDRLMKL
jgi:hypothetical protein